MQNLSNAKKESKIIKDLSKTTCIKFPSLLTGLQVHWPELYFVQVSIVDEYVYSAFEGFVLLFEKFQDEIAKDFLQNAKNKSGVFFNI